jgi:hypothetical protein
MIPGIESLMYLQQKGKCGTRPEHKGKGEESQNHLVLSHAGNERKSYLGIIASGVEKSREVTPR